MSPDRQPGELSLFQRIRIAGVLRDPFILVSRDYEAVRRRAIERLEVEATKAENGPRTRVGQLYSSLKEAGLKI